MRDQVLAEVFFDGDTHRGEAAEELHRVAEDPAGCFGDIRVVERGVDVQGAGLVQADAHAGTKIADAASAFALLPGGAFRIASDYLADQLAGRGQFVEPDSIVVEIGGVKHRRVRASRRPLLQLPFGIVAELALLVGDGAGVDAVGPEQLAVGDARIGPAERGRFGHSRGLEAHGETEMIQALFVGVEHPTGEIVAMQPLHDADFANVACHAAQRDGGRPPG